jgi:hypothetical protein
MSVDKITRQHLEDAARAAGHEVACSLSSMMGPDPVGGACGILMLRAATPGALVMWAPHLDDGGSRRLQIAVQMSLVVGGKSAAAGIGLKYARLIRHDGTPADAARAAREAVVLCAAEVGQRMLPSGHQNSFKNNELQTKSGPQVAEVGRRMREGGR